MSAPPTLYARNGDVHLGFQILGDGAIDVLQMGSGVLMSMQSLDDEPHAARFTERLTSMCRLIRYDPRGLGLSDALPEPPRVEDQCDDVVAVLDAAHVDQAFLLSAGFGTPAAILAAARYPDRVKGLILINAFARFIRASDYEWGITAEDFEAIRMQVTQPHRADEDTDSSVTIMPSLAADANFRAWWSRAGNSGASPRAAFAQWEPMLTLDLRDELPLIACPTLVLQSQEAWVFRMEHGEYLAQRISNASYVELPTADRLLFGGNAELALDEIEEFLTGARSGLARARVLATVLFTDIVRSTETAAQLGDRAWRARLDAHDHALRSQLRRFGGTEVNTTGDGFVARFDTPRSAIECGHAMIASAHEVGVEIRAGLHSGECELRGDDLAGLAVHIAARVAALADAAELLVTRTVRDLVLGSSLRFEPIGEHSLKGVPEAWQLFRSEST